jgi:hypothetical protein
LLFVLAAYVKEIRWRFATPADRDLLQAPFRAGLAGEPHPMISSSVSPCCFARPTFEAEDLEGLRVAEIIAAIQRMGFQVIRGPRIEDAEIAVKTDAAIGCLVVDLFDLDHKINRLAVVATYADNVIGTIFACLPL